MSRPPTQPPGPLSKNELRTILFVAAHGSVGRTALGEFQRALPTADWGALTMDRGWEPMKPLLSWDTAPLPELQSVPVGDLLRLLSSLSAGSQDFQSHDDRQVLEDLRWFLKGPESAAVPLLQEEVTFPRTELAVRLGFRRSRSTTESYTQALRLCWDEKERRRWADVIDFDVASRVLHAALDAMRRTYLFEAVDHARVARAILRKKSSVQLRQERFHVIFSMGDPDEVHRLFLLTRLNRRNLAAALGVEPKAIGPSCHPKEAVDAKPFKLVELDLRRAARARTRK